MKRSVVRATTSVALTAILCVGLFQPVCADDSYAWGALRDDDRPSQSASVKNGFTPSTKYKYSKMQKRIKEYQETSKNVKGWLTVPNTNINMPIVFSAKDNDYYMYRTWDGKNYPNSSYNNFVETSVYVDFRHKWGDTWRKSSKNTVLYGHNWTNLRPPFEVGKTSSHTMFGQLPSYTDLNFAKENPHIYYSTGENEGVWRVFSVGYCELSQDFFYNSPNPSTENYQKLLDEWKQRTLLNFDVDVNTSDRILTLSTCTRMYVVNGDRYSGNQRFVVVARLLREGESEDDAVKVTVNPNPKQPVFKK